MRRSVFLACLVVLLATVGATAAFAQSGDGSVRGYIKDDQGGALPGVTVTATSPALLSPSVGVTDNAGYYRLVNLPPGTYAVTAELTGFAVFRREGILLRAGSNFQVDITMKLGSLAETITVSGESPMIEISKPSNVLNIDGEFQREVPIAQRRNWSDFLELTPGVNSRPHDDGSGRTVYFGHATEHFAHVIQLDGMQAGNYNDFQITRVAMGADMIQDTQVKTGGVDASAPMGTGVVINVVTKSGGDQFKGSAAYAYQPKRWNGDNAAKAGTKFAGTPTIQQIKLFDGALGGPIRRDAVWFFGSFRRSDTVAGVSRTPREVAILRGFFPDRPLFDNKASSSAPYFKVTARLGPNHDLAALYAGDRSISAAIREYNYDPYSGELYGTGGSMYGGKLTSVWGKNVTTTFTANYNNKSGNTRETYEGKLGSGPMITIHQSAFAQAGRVVGTGRLLEGGNLPSMSMQPASLVMIRGDLTWFKEGWGGSHEFQTGFFAMPRNRYDQEVEYLNDGFIQEERRQIDPNNPAAGTVPFHRRYASPTLLSTRAARDRDLGLYVQDSWKPSRRVTANIGLRVDFVKRSDDIFKITRQSSTEVAPRLGFSYLLTEDAKNVLRGSYVRVHEQVMGRDAVTTFGASSKVSFRDEYDLDGDGRFESVILDPAVTASLGGYEFDPDIRQPYVDEFILGFRKQFPGQISVDVAGIKRAYKETYALVDVNGIYPDGPFQPFGGFGRIDPNRGMLQQQTNNTWSRLNYAAIEVTAAKNLSHGLQLMAGINRQWQHISGTWNPTDPARFIQPDAFPNNRLIYQPRGNNEHNGLATGTALTYGPTWAKYSMRFGGTWLAPWAVSVAASLVVQAGPWSGAIIDRLPANDPQLAVFGPATVVSSTGVRQPNPLATNLRFVYPTRGEGQVQAPAIKTLGLKIGKIVKLGGSREAEVAANIFNVLNAGNFNQYSYNGANQVYNPSYLEFRNQQGARALQMTFVFRF